MPSTENPTLLLIQREISEVEQREKELREAKNKTCDENGNNNTTPLTNGNCKNGNDLNFTNSRPVLMRAQSTSTLNINQNGYRKLNLNGNSKGMMQRFINSRGKLVPKSATNSNALPSKQTWNIPDIVDAMRIVPTKEPLKRERKGYVPVQERMKKELQDIYNRELELKAERRKSQPDFMSLYDGAEPEPKSNLRAAKSMAQLYDPDDYPEETVSAPPSLKPARSLAELCDATEEELPTPSSLIAQWEQIIQKNQQART